MPVKNIKELKTELRAKHKKLRLTCPMQTKTKLDNMLSERFLSSEQYENCHTLFAFVSVDMEVDTFVILQKALDDEKKLAVPKCRNKSGQMDFYYISSLDQLEKGAFSIMEPSEEKCEKVLDLSDGLCLVPGLCFDLQGYRIGFGKGYYDRFLQNFGGVTVGLCYSRCVERELPKGAFDKPVDILITEKYTNYTHNVFGEGMM